MVIACLVAVAAAALAATFVPSAVALEKGLIDCRLEGSTNMETRAAIIAEIGPTLGAHWVRLLVHWDGIEPQRGKYAKARLVSLRTLVDQLRAQGIKVILTVYRVPQWAQEQYWWEHPPPSVPKGPQPFYPIRDDRLGDFARFGRMLATYFAGRVEALECWNEPNTFQYIYPQRTRKDPYFAAEKYLYMLSWFHAGVFNSRTGMPVIAGATTSYGANDRYTTSPQRFAGHLAARGAGGLCEAISHHPYTPGASAETAPDRRPDIPERTVTFYNLGELLELFPDKPFYLTEFGYNTDASVHFGYSFVSYATQADYLKRAYACAAGYPQVKVLIWYLLWDAKTAGASASTGVYTGLRTIAGEKKPSWYAFQALP